jgi:hypothetical protein
MWRPLWQRAGAWRPSCQGGDRRGRRYADNRGRRLGVMKCQRDIARKSSTRKPITSASRASRARCGRIANCSRSSGKQPLQGHLDYRPRPVSRLEPDTAIHDVTWRRATSIRNCETASLVASQRRSLTKPARQHNRARNALQYGLDCCPDQMAIR